MNKVWNILLGGLLLAGTCGFGLAQSAVPEVGSLIPNQQRSQDVTGEIDRLLRAGSGDIMGGIQGYGVDYGEAIKQMVMDQVMEAVASALLLAPAAAKMLAKYQEGKNSDLADAVGEVKDVVKDMMSTQLKVRYQTLKVAHEKAQAMGRMTQAVRNSTSDQEATATMRDFYTSYTDFYRELSRNPAMLARLRTQHPGFDDALMALGNSFADPALQEAKLAMANQEYSRSAENLEVSAMSAYDRIMLKRQALRASRSQDQGIRAMQKLARVASQAQQHTDMKRRSAAALGLSRSY